MLIDISKNIRPFVGSLYLATWPLYSLRGGSYVVLFFNFLITVIFFCVISTRKSKFCMDIYSSILFFLIISSGFFYLAVSFGNSDGIVHSLKFIYYIAPAIVLIYISSFVKKSDCDFISKNLLYIGLIFQFLLIVVVSKFETSGGKFNYESSFLNFSSNELSYFYALVTFPFAFILYKRKKVSILFFLISFVFLFIHISKAHFFSLVVAFVAVFLLKKPFKATIFVLICAFFIPLLLPHLEPVGNKQIDKIIKSTNIIVDSVKDGRITVETFKIVLEEGYDRNRSAIAFRLKSQFLDSQTILGVGNKAESKINEGLDFHNTYYAIYYELGLLGLVNFILMVLFLFRISKYSEYKRLIYFVLFYFLIRSFFITFDYLKIVIIIYLIFKITDCRIISPFNSTRVCNSARLV